MNGDVVEKKVARDPNGTEPIQLQNADAALKYSTSGIHPPMPSHLSLSKLLIAPSFSNPTKPNLLLLLSSAFSSMYPSSSSSSSSSSSQSMSHAPTGLTRYGSAPGSLLTTTVDALIGGSRPNPTPYYSGGDSPDSTSKDQTSYHNHALGSALLRQKSSPAGFLSHLAAATTNHNHNHTLNGAGFTITRGSRLKSQLSFTGHCQESLCGGDNSNNLVLGDHAGFGMEPWDGSHSHSNSIAFSTPPPKRSKNSNSADQDILHCLNALESQFSLPQTTLEMATVEKLLHIPEDSVPCKIRAKRGCATHPRSIAERERRTRISGKLKKLQDLVPNMDKQTSYADMLDLAVQHIKGLQTQVQKLHKELENCSCGCAQSK
ncbi:hypothetical protein PHAVU_007G002200 [Phaseolus vulgaris]|uniref:BHLH domain-containing protein n=1 Tax=Phaseolus vulgaris TaxID=3885 RepID=V7BAJ5_PHAVU|nr:hypothetical protein PHAVU_007G002200g [Phaseolus vulgaris]ESW14605.1 hypothetical protein PHAVU_007G002200g [Phaseolus vulgaris]